MSTTEITETVPTSQLRTGDLVLTHDLRVRLGERGTSSGRGGHAVWYFAGTIENYDEVKGLPLYRGLIVDGQWPIQGNDLATWTRVVDG